MNVLLKQAVIKIYHAIILLEMHEFFTLLEKIYPLYLMVAAGYIAGRFLKVSRDTISSLLIFIIAPAVVFYGVATAPHKNSYLLLPVLFYIIGCLLSVAFYELGKYLWNGKERNLLGFIAGTGNTGYFGIPLIISLFGQRGLNVASFATLGLILYESTRGYYIISKGTGTSKQALQKVLKLPALYAFLLGLIISHTGVHISGSINDAFVDFKGAYTVFGMMILGVGLATVTRATYDKTFALMSFFAKFICFPLLIGLFVWWDASTLHLFSSEVHQIILILSIAPMASNTVTYATYLKAHPEKAAFTVFLSTIFALIYIPAFIAVILNKL